MRNLSMYPYLVDLNKISSSTILDPWSSIVDTSFKGL